MKQDRAVVILVLFEQVDEEVEVVPVVRSHVLEAELFEQEPRHDHVLEHLFHVVRESDHFPAHEWDAVHDSFRQILERVVFLPLDDLIEIPGDRADIRRDRHVVVIEDQEEFAFEVTSLIESLEGETARERAVTDDGDRAIVLFPEIARNCDAECCRDRG